MKSVKRRLALALVVVLALYALFVAITSGGVQRGRPEPPVVAGDAPSVADAAASLAPASAPAEPERVPVRVEATPDDAPAAALPLVELGPREGLLQVRVVALETKGPVAGATVQLETPAGGLLGLASVERARGTWLERLVTDSYGRADFRVPSGQPFVIHVRPELPPGRSARLSVRPLEPGLYRTAVVGVFTDPVRTWCARVVDGVTGEGIPGARLSFGSGVEASLFEARTARDGRVCLELGTSPAVLVVGAEGYGTEMTGLVDGGPGGEQVVELLRHADLEIVLRTDDGRQLAGARVQVHLLPPPLSFDDPVRDDRTDAEGRAAFENLPAGWRIAVAVHGEGLLRAEELVLAGGERRELLWTVGGRATLSGRVRDERGEPVQASLRLLPASARSEPGNALYPTELGLSATSDSEGRFRFDGVPAGEWRLEGLRSERGSFQGLIGSFVASVPPRETYFVPIDEAQDGSSFAIEPQELAVGGEPLEIEVRAWRTLFIRGRLEPDGDRLYEGLLVRARSPGYEVASTTEGGGAFVLGPLLPGEYELFAEVDAHSEWRLAGVSAGTDGVVLTPADAPAR